MKTTWNNSLKAIAAALLFVGWVGMHAFAGDLSSGQTDGSVHYVHAADGSVTMHFPEQKTSSKLPPNPPHFVAGTVVADGGALQSPFSGDYRAAGVTGLTCRVMSDGHRPGSAHVFLQGRSSGRIWVNLNLAVSDVADVWLTSALSFDRASGGWQRGGTDLDAKWEEDLSDVGLIGIRISQGGRAAQAYSIAGFSLVDDSGISIDAPLTPLQRALKERFNVTEPEAVSEAARQEDSTGDGMTDFMAILMTYDEEFGQALFFAEILAVGNEGVTLRWPGIQGWKHTVLRTDSLWGGFTSLPDRLGVDLTTDETGYMIFTDTTAVGQAGPFYYRILRRQ